MNSIASAPRAFSNRSLWQVGLGLLLALVGAIVVTVSAQPMPPDGMHGMHGGPMMGGSPERMGRMLDRMLDGLDASDAQRAQIKQIAASAGADMKAQAEAGRDLRKKAMQIFTAPTVDAAAAEQVRQQMLQQHDRTSRRMMEAMIAAANVLTPEQRAKIGSRLRDRQARMDERMRREQPPR